MKTTTNAKVICLSVTAGWLVASVDLALAQEWEYSVHGGVANLPRYSGSDERMTTPVLGGKIVSPWGIFLDTHNGLGWGHDWENTKLSIFVGPSTERKDSKKNQHFGSDKLRGMGSIDSRAEFGISGSYTLGSVEFEAILKHAVKDGNDKENGLDYTHLELAVGTNFYKGQYGSFDANLNSRFGDSNYMQTWYGVSEHQASRSQFKAYKASGGMISNGTNLVWSLPITKQTTFATVLDVQYLTSEAGKSPIVERRLQTSMMGQVVYNF
jgi:outer membrane scaffolding protein for murein synthesis (MipA/OmpV family)